MELTPRASERLALVIVYLIGERHVRGERPWTSTGLARRLRIPTEPLAAVLEMLCRHGLLVRTDASPPGYVPRRDLTRVRINDVLDVVRGQGRTRRQLSAQDLPPTPLVDRVLADMEAAMASALGERTVGELVTSGLADEKGAGEKPSELPRATAERSRSRTG